MKENKNISSSIQITNFRKFINKIKLITNKLNITLKEANKWDSLKYTYDEYKDLLISKYGEGESFEHFAYPYDKEGLEMIALMNNKCTYATFFNLPINRIFIMISYVSGSGNVSLVYINKKNQTLYFVMMDIDNFKLVNDLYGHQEGDEVLRSVALKLKKVGLIYKSSLFLARYAGDEFAAVYETADPKSVRRLVKDIKAAISEIVLEDKNVTISVGTAAYAGKDMPMEQLFELADKALNKKPVWQRFIITAAGATVNIVAGFLAMIILTAFINIGNTRVAQYHTEEDLGQSRPRLHGILRDVEHVE